MIIKTRRQIKSKERKCECAKKKQIAVTLAYVRPTDEEPILTRTVAPQ